MRQDEHVEARAARLARGGLQADPVASDDLESTAPEPAIARLRRLGDLSALPEKQVTADRRRRLVPAPPPAQRRDGVAVAGGVGDRRPRADRRRLVAHHVGEGERHDPRGEGGARQPAALDARQVLAHRVQFVDRRAAPQQQLGEPGLVAKRHARDRGRQQRRRAAREQHQQHVVGREPLGERERLARRAQAASVRQRMARDEQAGAAEPHVGGGAGHRQRLVEPVAEDALGRGSHARGGLAHRQSDQPARAAQLLAVPAQPSLDQRERIGSREARVQDARGGAAQAAPRRERRQWLRRGSDRERPVSVSKLFNSFSATSLKSERETRSSRSSRNRRHMRSIAACSAATPAACS
jgi:hypothetical protein